MKEYDSSTHEPSPKDEEDRKSGNDDVRRCDVADHDNQTSNNSDNELDEDSVWDGSESEYVEDDDAAIYEEKYTGIKLNYTLKTDEIYTCLKSFSEYKKKQKKVVIETILLVIVGLGFLISGFMRNDINGYIFCVISALLIVVIWTVPNLIIKSHAKEISKNQEIYAEIYPDEIVLGSNGLERNIELDGSCAFSEIDNLFVVMPPKDNMIIIPIRSIEPDFLPDVEAMLIAGTHPFGSEDI